MIVVQAGDHGGHGGGGKLLTLRRAGPQLAGHFLVHGGERGPVAVAVAGQRGHSGVRLVHPEPVKLLGEPGERGGQQHPVIQHRPGVVMGEHAVVGLPDGGHRGRRRRRRCRRRAVTRTAAAAHWSPASRGCLSSSHRPVHWATPRRIRAWPPGCSQRPRLPRPRPSQKGEPGAISGQTPKSPS